MTRPTRAAVLSLSLIAVLAAGVVLMARWGLRDAADVARLQTLRATLRAVPMPAHDNDPAIDPFPLNDDMRRNGVEAIYVARAAGQIVGVYAFIQVPGYADRVELLVGIDGDRVTGVSLLEQHETEGYGGRLGNEDRDWLEVFSGRRLAASGDATWRVRQDGGGVDAISGATITSRSLLRGVRDALDAIHRAGVMPPRGDR